MQPSQKWLLVVAFGLLLVAIGFLVDMLLRKREVRTLHDHLLRIGQLIENTSLREWQVRIANTGLLFIERAALIPSYLLVPLHPLILFFIIVGVTAGYFFTDLWFFGPIFVFLGIGFAVGIWLNIEEQFSFDLVTSSDLAEDFLAALGLSAIISLIAIIISTAFLPNSSIGYWFDADGTLVVPHRSAILTLANFVFDFATLIVTIGLLKIVVRHRRFILSIAFCDIFASALLTYSLHVVLLFAAGVERPFHYSASWFLRFARELESAQPTWSNIEDLHLLPLLLTTFVPVATYMLVFVLLSFAKPVLWLSARLFGAIGERDESVFRQLGMLVGTFVAAIKAIYDFFVSI